MSVDLERVRGSLDRMMDYCDRIAFHMHRFGGKEEFLKDWSYQDACVMILAQIGEEAKRIESWLKSKNTYGWSDVIRFRDFAYHNYQSTDYSIVWEIISIDVPQLYNVLKELAASLETDAD